MGIYDSQSGYLPGPYGPSTLNSHAILSPQYPLLIIKLSSFACTVPGHSAFQSSHPVGTPSLLGARIMLCADLFN